MKNVCLALAVVAVAQTPPTPPRPSYRSSIVVHDITSSASKVLYDRAARVQLRTVAMPGDRADPVPPRTVVELTGGQGTINVNSWSPDSKRFAYVTYQVTPGR